MFDHILVTLDGSGNAEQSLRYAQDLAALTGARVSLLSVVLPSETLPSEAPASGAAPDDSRGRRWLTYLDEKAAALREAGVGEVSAQIRFGDAASLIVDFAREEQADLLVMSTLGMGATGRDAVGSVALQVLMIAPCPIFMVRINEPEPPRTPAEERWQVEGGQNVG